MDPIRNILVIVDPTATQHSAITKGALLAAKFHTRLELFICDTRAAREARLVARARAAAEPAPFDVKAMLEELAAPLREQGLDVATTTECRDPLHEGLMDRARRTTADLVVKDTHHHSWAKRTFLTNTDWHLIRTCPVPLLLTKSTQWPSTPNVMAAVDPGHENDKPAVLDNRILDYGSHVAQKLGGKLHLVHAYIPIAIVAAATASKPPMAMAVSAEDLAHEEKQKRAELQELSAGYRVDPANIHLQVGSPAEVLPRVAESQHADIVLMGAISRSATQRAFIGNTAEEVLERLPCDALIVKPPDFASALPF